MPTWANAAAAYPLTAEFQQDVSWWATFVSSWNGKALLPPAEWQRGDITYAEVFTDACTTGWGAVHDEHWCACTWNEAEEAMAMRNSRDSMPWKELYAIVRAVATWGHSWAGKQVLLHCDCMPVVLMWRKGDSAVPQIAALLRTLWLLCATHDFTLTITHIAGTDNVCADLLSRNQIEAFKALRPPNSPSPTILLPLPTHSW